MLRELSCVEGRNAKHLKLLIGASPWIDVSSSNFHKIFDLPYWPTRFHFFIPAKRSLA